LLPVSSVFLNFFFFFQAEDGIRDGHVTGVQTCALPISPSPPCARPTPAPRRCWSSGNLTPHPPLRKAERGSDGARAGTAGAPFASAAARFASTRRTTSSCRCAPCSGPTTCTWFGRPDDGDPYTGLC